MPDPFQEALARHRAGDLVGAERAYRAALAAGPNVNALGNLGLLLWRTGRLEEAEATLRAAAEAAPEMAALHYNLGRFLHSVERFPEAEARLREAIRLDPGLPNARLDLGNLQLAMGQLSEGWALFEERPERRNSPARQLPFPEWRGEDLAGKRLLVWREQGLGDQIFAARFLQGTGAASVTLATLPSLSRLLAPLVDDVMLAVGDVFFGQHDYWALPLSLPRWAAAAQAPYLHGSPRRSGRIGVVWRGNPRPDPGRSLDPAQAARLLALPGAICLHPEDTGARDLQDTADLIAGLDVVVTIDTSVAHLAGAMGKRTIVLLQRYCSDWRWTLDWYPSVEIIKQPTPGDWAAVVDAVAARLG
ncbi:tetratricopeptide repeat protein [Phenylobacterium sp. J367]|uniref:tetratricopeptide repeat protein n=1 Tax=Phenylobacterium sp. J367 TaxID=2898435 RepID=UPI0021510FB6|nr:tetratricopeptide repeat protein [Phenylobacterium sp. J367]MCR5879843.1 tetratricopeptide repeat protein [Phenylobacterium sp. J367]